VYGRREGEAKSAMCELTLMLFTIAVTMISNRSATKTKPINMCLNLDTVDAHYN